MILTISELTKMLESTDLRPEATAFDIGRLCREAIETPYPFGGVCVHSSFVTLAHQMCRGSSVKVCSVIGFSSGASSTAAKCAEAQDAISHGATELDMVIHIGHLLVGNVNYVRDEIWELARLAHDNDFANDVILKVIIETAKLTDAQKIIACRLAKEAGADFVKTCTGFGGGEATPEDVALMRANIHTRMGVKASCKVSSFAKVQLLYAAGACRFGSSAAVSIRREAIAAGMTA